MEMIANYQIVNDNELSELLEISDTDRCLQFIEELQGRDMLLLGIGRMWDALHFILCGVSASNPIEGYPLSEAIVGEDVVCEEYFISYTSKERMYKIVRALENVDFEKVLSDFDLDSCKKNNIYPRDWEIDKDVVLAELREGFANMTRFYRLAYEKRKSVVISIY